MTWMRSALLILLLAAPGVPRAAERAVVLVVNADSEVRQLEPIEVQKLFLGIPVVRASHTLHPVLNRSDEQLSNVFLQHIVAMSQSAYDRRILAQVVQQGRPRPLELSNSKQILGALVEDRFAVSYMWRHDIPATPRLRILRVLWTE